MAGYRYSALVVDDEDAVRQLTVRALERHGFRCTEAHDGAEAARLLAVRQFHALISDLRMANGNGYSLTTDVLERVERPLIVILTGVLEPRLAQDLVRRGVDDIMFKPVDYEMFAGKVAGLMARRIDLTTEQPVGALPAGSPEIHGIATAREAKDMIEGRNPEPANTAIADLPSPVAGDHAATALQPHIESAPSDKAAGDDRVHESQAKPAEPIVSPSGSSPPVSPRTPGALFAIAARIRRWAAALQNLTGLQLVWLAVAGSIMFSLWLSMQVHMLRQMNRAVEALEQLGARISISETAGAAVGFEAGQRPSGLDQLHAVPDLRRLELSHTRITDRDLEIIGSLTGLEELDLEQTEITDSGLAHLKHLGNLRRLSLHGTRVTDAGLVHLKRLRSLRALSLRETGVSAQAAKALQQAMPLTRIDHSSLVARQIIPSPRERGARDTRSGR
jgi:CheY-like chemotaxis protein